MQPVSTPDPRRGFSPGLFWLLVLVIAAVVALIASVTQGQTTNNLPDEIMVGGKHYVAVAPANAVMPPMPPTNAEPPITKSTRFVKNCPLCSQGIYSERLTPSRVNMLPDRTEIDWMAVFICRNTNCPGWTCMPPGPPYSPPGGTNCYGYQFTETFSATNAPVGKAKRVND